MRYDSIVIGGGLIGVTSAFALAQAGHKVLVVEALDELAFETSYANGGMLTASMPEPWNGPGVTGHLLSSLFDPHSAMKLRLTAVPGLMRWGIAFLLNSTAARHQHAINSNYSLSRVSVLQTEKLIDELAIECGAADTGTLKTFANEDAMGGPLETAKNLQKLGLEYRKCSTSEVIELEPQLEESSHNIAGGIYYTGDRSGDARKFTLALARHCESMGVQFRTGKSVTKIVSHNGQIVSVHSSDEEWETKKVIVAAGNASPSIVRSLGIYLPIKPAKGYSVTIPTTGWNALPKIPVVDDALHAAVVPLGDNIRVAGTAEFAGFNKTLSTNRIENLFNLLRRIYPQLSSNVERSLTEPWTGLRPMSCDGLPYIGPAGPTGLWINSGHGHLGWTMAVGSASLLVDMMLGRSTEIDPSPFRVER